MDYAAKYGRKIDAIRHRAKAAREQAVKKDGSKDRWQTKKK